MSIIYDALKKVEGSQSGDSRLEENRAVKQKFYQRARFVYLSAGLAAVMLVGLGISLSFYVRQAKGRAEEQLPPALAKAQEAGAPSQKAPASAQNTGLSSRPVAAAPVPPVAPKALVEAPNFVLNGIFFSDEQGYALVNNQIVMEHDTVEGAVVKRISMNEVELDFQGTPIKLSSKR